MVTDKIPFKKIMFGVKENEFPEDDRVLIYVYAEGNDVEQFIIPFKKMSDIKEFSDGLLKAINEIRETYPEFAERNK